MFRRHSTHTLERGHDERLAPSWDEDPDHRPVGDRFVDDGDPVGHRSLPPPVATPMAPPPSPYRRDERAAAAATISSQRFSFAGLLAGVAGVGLLVLGLVAVLRGGLGGAIDDPVVEVLGFTHTPLLGLVEIGMGLLLIAGAASASRGLLSLLGVVAVVGGAVAVSEPAQLQARLAVERSFGWIWVIGGAVITLAAWLLPVYDRQTRREHRIEDIS